MQYKIIKTKIVWFPLFLSALIIVLKQLISHIISILSNGEKKTFLLLSILSLMTSIFDIAAIAFLFVVINFYSPQQSFNISFLMSWGFEPRSLQPALLLIVFFIFKSVVGYYVYKMQYRFVYKVASRLSRRNLLLFLEGSFIDHVNIDSSVLIKRISQQPIEFAHYVLAGIQQMITEIILITLTITALIVIDAKLLVVVSLVLIPAIFILRNITKRRLASARKNIKTTGENVLKHLNESLSGFIESNIYNKNDFFINRYSHSQNDLNTYLADLQITQGMPSRFFEIFAVFGLFMLILINELSGTSKIADVFTVGAFAAAAYKIIPGISKIINFVSQVKIYGYTVKELAREKYRQPRQARKDNTESLESL